MDKQSERFLGHLLSGAVGALSLYTAIKDNNPTALLGTLMGIAGHIMVEKANSQNNAWA
ncbi:hypothetical protein [Alicyclobacillus sp. ALC3]|uniref:hypothetical protein n=1 Tax=Alicyclobacillus sp. ALC3 TaxID=2796143 RepID=UPI002378300D|nr:hypothetical protein [Alicyclobacillus sp. ALC3]WDL99181.1 hypothetical protein JC200_11370 [Alicyclobacillus sp. ALC3]